MSITPAMQQYYDLKQEVPDAVLFFRMGDFYEMFGEDAHIAHKILGISITSRNKNASEPIALAGIPYHAKQKYLPTLVNAGYKVAIAEQVSDPKLKGIVKREIVRVVTPSTLELEGEDYRSTSSENLITSIVEDNGMYGISILDINTNIWKSGEFHDFECLKTELYKLATKEVILEKKLFLHTELKDILEKKYSLNIYYFDGVKKPDTNLKEHFGVKNLIGFGLDGKKLAVSASSLLLEYVKGNQKSDLHFLDNISYLSFDNYMNLDEATIKSLDLVYNFSTKSQSLGTLFGVLNKTKTSSGTRLLKDNILKPLQTKEEIKKRQDFIHEFYSNKLLLDSVRKQLEFVSDIDSILNRLALNRSNPRDLLNLKRSLESILAVHDIIKKDGSIKLFTLINNGN